MRKAWFRVSEDDVAEGDDPPSSDCPCCGHALPFGRGRSGIVLSTEEAAFVLGVSRPTIVRLIETGWLHGAKRGHWWRVNLDEVVRVLTLEATRRSQALDDVVRARQSPL
jgi:excisionase family DNA binding protein